MDTTRARRQTHKHSLSPRLNKPLIRQSSRHRRQRRPSNKSIYLTCAPCPKLVQGFILLSVGIVAVSSSNIRASPASSRRSPMDLCLRPPSHMCPLTSLCLCCTRLVIFEPFTQRNCPVAHMSCLIYCFPSSMGHRLVSCACMRFDC